MQIYGYHRTSTKEQHLDRGIQEIERYCNEHEMALTNIFTDQETGKNFNRPRYTVLVEDVLRPGDILIVTELDRLGRNKYDTMQQIQRIKNMGYSAGSIMGQWGHITYVEAVDPVNKKIYISHCSSRRKMEWYTRIRLEWYALGTIATGIYIFRPT